MGYVKISEDILQNMAEAIREVTGTTESIVVSDMPDFLIDSLMGDDISLTDIVSYYQTPTQNMCDYVNALSSDWVSFVAVTDTHNGNNKNHSQNVIRYLLKNSKANKLMWLGDVSASDWNETQYKNWVSSLMIAKRKIFFTIGNHERFGTTVEATRVIYEDLLKDKSYLVGDPSNFYYYFDDSSRKIRYLFISTSNNGAYTVSNEQIRWIEESVILPTKDWSLVTFSHIDINPDLALTGTWKSAKSEEISSAIAKCNGRIVGHFCGHEHIDNLSVTKNRFYQAILLADKFENDNYFNVDNWQERVAGTYSEQSISVVSFNLNTGNVVIKKIGAGVEMSYNFLEYQPEDRPDVVSISVNWGATSAEVGTDTKSLINSVTASYDDGTSKNVTGYTVSPSVLSLGSNTVTVTFEEKIASMVITGTPIKRAWESGVPYNVEFVANEYVTLKGDFSAYNGWKRSDYLNCDGASYLMFTDYVNPLDFRYTAFYDADKKRISGMTYETVDGGFRVNIPTNAVYFTYSGVNISMDAFVVTPYE